MQLRQDVERLKDQNRLLKEKLEYFTDRYGLPEGWEKEVFRKENIIQPAENNVAELPKSTVVQIDQAKLAELNHQRLVVHSLTELLKIQLSDLLETIANQNKLNVQAYNSILSLRDKLREFDK